MGKGHDARPNRGPSWSPLEIRGVPNTKKNPARVFGVSTRAPTEIELELQLTAVSLQLTAVGLRPTAVSLKPTAVGCNRRRLGCNQPQNWRAVAKQEKISACLGTALLGIGARRDGQATVQGQGQGRVQNPARKDAAACFRNPTCSPPRNHWGGILRGEAAASAPAWEQCEGGGHGIDQGQTGASVGGLRGGIRLLERLVGQGWDWVSSGWVSGERV